DLHNQLQQLQRQLRQTEALAALGKITSIVLHEIGNPLQALLSHVELIEAGKGNAHDHVRRIGTELLRLQQLVAELRQLLYHPTAGSALSAVDLLHVLQQTLHLLQPQFQRDHVRVQLQPHCPTAVILGNAAQLEQLFLNLFLNARDAMPDGGVLRITLSCEGNHLIVECSDTGHGIPADVLEHVFEPFFTTKPQGSGLGLSIARNIVQQHGGDITIASQPSMGTTVTLRFPLMHQVKQADTAPPCETPSS
ncbi:MAG: ATP-binding protein, partial [Candidatus Kapabacteria bacterium]|nr:ATP-binding protein [Candidatus Kapabacteria bacterium]MDW7996810.1 ATP-binding protein [Bacteroidota bacterium]